MTMHRRKNIRLAEYDYSQGGYYFITICTKDRAKTLWNNQHTGDCPTVGAGIASPSSPCNNGIEYALSPTGEIIKTSMENMPNFYPNANVDKYAIMPNHVHMILVLEDAEGELGRAMPAPTVSRIVNQIKGIVRLMNISKFIFRQIQNYCVYIFTKVGDGTHNKKQRKPWQRRLPRTRSQFTAKKMKLWAKPFSAGQNSWC